MRSCRCGRLILHRPYVVCCIVAMLLVFALYVLLLRCCNEIQAVCESGGTTNDLSEVSTCPDACVGEPQCVFVGSVGVPLN